MFSIFVPKCTGGDPMVLLQRKLYFSKDPEGCPNTYKNPIEPVIFLGGLNTEAVILIVTEV